MSKIKRIAFLVFLLSGIMILNSCGNTEINDSVGISANKEVINEIANDNTDNESNNETIDDSKEVETANIITDIEIEEPESNGILEIHYIDVGQGDCTLIKCNNSAMLIDSGDDSKGTAIQNYLNKQGIKKLDYLILTHPDSDHVGAAPVIITKFKIDKVFVSNYEKDSKTYFKVIQALDDKRLKYSTPKVGTTYKLDTAEFAIIAPNDKYSNSNDSSIGLVLQHGDNRFLFTGDAEEKAENDILSNDIDVDVNVYKAAHHGSKTASSEEFLIEASPEFAVISCGEGNSYGHPNAQTLNTLRAMGIKVFRTDEQGTIVATSDGKDIKWNCSPTDSWLAGESKSSVSVNKDDNSKNETSSATITSSKKSSSSKAKKEVTYILNTKTKKFHKTSCSYLPTTNKKNSTSSRSQLIKQGYDPCKKCNP